MGEAFLHPKKLIIDGIHTVVINGVPIFISDADTMSTVEIFKDVKAGIEDMNKPGMNRLAWNLAQSLQWYSGALTSKRCPLCSEQVKT